ncbi:hypothetical protein Y032_0004g1807 [Ancylostoma ceylanicum]|uniref:Endonuclease/exonuclease/phosphatase domain-containing protein n=1 Tax=Ancylostoma ceylanicum TaxID=53326 RepID=A0A016VU39_9BILA|nr:hypothetical protein Y032_0004g1807 [Ancylostoma ceylanicum]
MSIDSFEQLSIRIGRLRLGRCGSMPALTLIVAYASTSSYDDDKIETYTNLVKFCGEDHTFYGVIIGDFNARIGRRRKPEELHICANGLHWNEQGERHSKIIAKTIYGNSQYQKLTSLRWT